MAIVKMKRLRFLAPADRREELLARLQRVGCVELSEPAAELGDPAWSALLRREESALTQARQDLALVQAALRSLQRYAPPKRGLFRPRRQVREEELLCGRAMELALERAGEIDRWERERTALQAQRTRLEAGKAAVRPWMPLDVDLAVRSTEHVSIALFVCPAGVELETLREELAQQAPTAQLIEASTDREQHYFLFLCHRAQEQAADLVLKAHGASRAALKGLTGTARENLADLTARQTQVDGLLAELEERISGQAAHREELELGADRLRQRIARQEAAQRGLTDGTVLFFTGWVTASGLPAAQRELERLSCAWESADPAPKELSEVPVRLENNWFTRPLNMVTEMYALPAYDGVDPNPLMAPFFIFFYGFMMADMGYGLLMMLASWLILRRGSPRGPTMRHMIPLLGLCGVSTFLMGALTGGFFGDLIPQLVRMTTGRELAFPALFSPLDDALAVLLGSLLLGGLQIFTGMAVSMYRQIKRGEVLSALCGEGAWYAVFLLFALGVWTGRVQAALAVIAVLLVVTQGYGKKGLLGKLLGIGGSLYNNLTGYFSDILSYSRLMALMLAGAVIAQVFNTLGALTGHVVSFFLIAMVGNALNFALNLLGCYVHDMRLQCLEYFGRFYTDGGKPFRPLAFDTEYVDIVQE